MKTTGQTSGYRANALEPSRLEREGCAQGRCGPGLAPFFMTGWEELRSPANREGAGHLGERARQKLALIRPVLGFAVLEAAWRAELQCEQAGRERQLEAIGPVLAKAQELSALLACCP